MRRPTAPAGADRTATPAPRHEKERTMEFGIFLQGYLPGTKAHDPDAEHLALTREMELAQAADRYGFKFVWLTEHHGLTEYSHMSASGVHAGYLAATTDRIHIGAGIFNISPRVNHPVRTAEKVATLDHLTNRRFEFGTGRGAGATRSAPSTSTTRSRPGPTTTTSSTSWCGCGSRRTTHTTAPTGTWTCPTTCCPSRGDRGTRRSGWRSARRRRGRRPATSARVPSASPSRRCTTSPRGSRPTRRGSRSAPTRWVSSSTTTS